MKYKIKCICCNTLCYTFYGYTYFMIKDTPRNISNIHDIIPDIIPDIILNTLKLKMWLAVL